MTTESTTVTAENGYPFSTIIPVRITDINYGMHLGHVATAGIFHNARVLFLNTNGFDEMNVDGLGMLLVSSCYYFINAATFNTQLVVSVGIGEYSKSRFKFLYKATDKKSCKEVVSCQEEVIFFDYSKGKVSRIPAKFLEFCERAQVKTSELASNTSE